MSKQSLTPEQDDMAEQTELHRLLLEGAAPVAPPLAMKQRLAARLDGRLAASVLAHAQLLTVRVKQGVWQTLTKGIRYKPLWQGPEGNSVLVEFAPGAALPVHRHNWLEEGIVLHGGLQMGQLDLGRFDYHLSPAHSRHGQISSKQGALAFLRGTSLGDKGRVFQELLGGLLPHPGGEAKTVYVGDEGWERVHEGLYKKELYADRALSSRFYRLEPGTACPGHTHLDNEECLILSGEAFLGDMLLREGDYQLAPAGSVHGETYTDVGALLYVRGAVQ
jgi:quercetin dioxygenase-like cupin family protein